jgi:plasmid stabilization system protein ParE
LGARADNIYITQFDDTFHVLSDKTEIGGNYNYIKENYQKPPQGSHIIFIEYQTQTAYKLFVLSIKIWMCYQNLAAQNANHNGLLVLVSFD